VIVTVAFVVLVTLCLGGGTTSLLVVQNLEPKGTPTPEEAVEGFLRGVFTERSAANAGAYVCAENRSDDQLTRLVFEVRQFQRRNSSTDTRWTYPPVTYPARRRASADVTLRFSTVDSQPVERRLKLTLVDRLGWWVCEVETPR